MLFVGPLANVLMGSSAAVDASVSVPAIILREIERTVQMELDHSPTECLDSASRKGEDGGVENGCVLSLEKSNASD